MMATSWWDSPSSTPAHADIPYEAGDLPGADEDRRLGRCEKIAALPPAVRKGSALPDLRFKIKLFGFSRLPESRRLSAQQAAEPQGPAIAIFSHLLGLRSRNYRLCGLALAPEDVYATLRPCW